MAKYITYNTKTYTKVGTVYSTCSSQNYKHYVTMSPHQIPSPGLLRWTWQQHDDKRSTPWCVIFGIEMSVNKILHVFYKAFFFIMLLLRYVTSTSAHKKYIYLYLYNIYNIHTLLTVKSTMNLRNH